MGQNMVGWVRLTIQGEKGTTLTFRYAEALNSDGTIYTANLRTARSTDHYTLKGDGDDIWEPRFSFHGFRYIEVQGLTEAPSEETITGIVIHSEIPAIGSFECSDPLINQLQQNIVWGQKGNFVDIPTDCPQRDERLGWTGDAQVFARTAAFNMNVAGFFTKWIRDLEDAQSPEGAFPPRCPPPPRLIPRGRRTCLGGRRCDHPLDDLPVLRRCPPARKALSIHAAFHCVPVTNQQRWYPLL
jgi:alpha-L-rhamnosidase